MESPEERLQAQLLAAEIPGLPLDGDLEWLKQFYRPEMAGMEHLPFAGSELGASVAPLVSTEDATLDNAYRQSMAMFGGIGGDATALVAQLGSLSRGNMTELNPEYEDFPLTSDKVYGYLGGDPDRWGIDRTAGLLLPGVVHGLGKLTARSLPMLESAAARASTPVAGGMHGMQAGHVGSGGKKGIVSVEVPSIGDSFGGAYKAAEGFESWAVGAGLRPGAAAAQKLDVMVNPSQAEVSRFAGRDIEDLRIMIDNDGNVYAWDGQAAIHNQVIEGLGLKRGDIKAEYSDDTIWPRDYEGTLRQVNEDFIFDEPLVPVPLRGGSADLPQIGSKAVADDLPRIGSEATMPPALPPMAAARKLYTKVQDETAVADDFWTVKPSNEFERLIHASMGEHLALNAGTGKGGLSSMTVLRTRGGDKTGIADRLVGKTIDGETWTKAKLNREVDKLVTDKKVMLPQEPRALEVTHRMMAQGPATQPQRTSILDKVYSGSPPVTTQRGFGEVNFGDLKRSADSTIASIIEMDSTTHTSAVDDAWKIMSDTYEIPRGQVSTTKQNYNPDGLSLLTKNAKMLKAEAGFKGKGVNKATKPLVAPDGRGVETTGLSLYHGYKEPGFNSCPGATAGCFDNCLSITAGLNFAYGGGALEFGGGPLAMKGPRLAHFARMQASLRDPEAMMMVLDDEVGKALVGTRERGNMLGVRLNVLSDIPPKTYKALMDKYPDVTFFDYTKLSSNKPIAPNHDLTYSSTGVSQPGIGVNNPDQNWQHMVARMEEGHAVAMPFTTAPGEALPKWILDKKTGKKYEIVDADTHDFRPADKWGKEKGSVGFISGLRNKSNHKGIDAARESNGFFTYHEPGTDTVEVAAQGKIGKGTLAGVTLPAAFFLAQFPHWDDYNPELGAELAGL